MSMNQLLKATAAGLFMFTFFAHSQVVAAPKKKVAPKTEAAKPSGPVELGKHGDWGAYMTQSAQGKVCYALAEPQKREPKTLKRDPGYLFISYRPNDKVKGEISFRMGFVAKETAKAVVGASSFTFYTHNESAWIKNASEEAQLLEAMKKGDQVVFHVTSKKGNDTKDTYSLKGISAALEQAAKECN